MVIEADTPLAVWIREVETEEEWALMFNLDLMEAASSDERIQACMPVSLVAKGAPRPSGTGASRSTTDEVMITAG